MVPEFKRLLVFFVLLPVAAKTIVVDVPGGRVEWRDVNLSLEGTAESTRVRFEGIAHNQTGRLWENIVFCVKAFDSSGSIIGDRYSSCVVKPHIWDFKIDSAETVQRSREIRLSKKKGKNPPAVAISRFEISYDAGTSGTAAPVSTNAVSLEQGNAREPASEKSTGAPGAVEYRIGPGDILQVIVWKEADASVPSVAVRADGRISLPLIREVEVAGLTPDEARKLLSEKYSRLIHGADVTVLVKEINSQKVYLVGAVKKEGAIRLQSAMTVLQVLAEGGGVTDYAKKKKIYVLRTENQRQIRLPFDYEAVIRGEKMEQNIFVRPGDSIVVPQ